MNPTSIQGVQDIEDPRDEASSEPIGSRRASYPSNSDESLQGSKTAPRNIKNFSSVAGSPSVSAEMLKRGRLILVVDDDEDTAISLAKVLELWGYQAMIAFDGDSAISKALAEPPDFALLDLRLPRMNGFEVARRLRREFGNRLKLVAITGCNPNQTPEAWELNFDDYLIKPTPPTVLRSLLEHWMDEQSSGAGTTESGQPDAGLNGMT